MAREPGEVGETRGGGGSVVGPIDDTHTMNIRVNFTAPGHKKSEVEHRTDHAVSIPGSSPYWNTKQGRPSWATPLPPLIAEQDATMLDSLGRSPIARMSTWCARLRDHHVTRPPFEDLEVIAQGGDPPV